MPATLQRGVHLNYPVCLTRPSLLLPTVPHHIPRLRTPPRPPRSPPSLSLSQCYPRMPPKQSSANSPPPPALGTLIDNDTLELVEVLGVGGYGVVYRAVDPLMRNYAVKCLITSQVHSSSRQRQLHMREIALHRLASAHPNVVTLHRIVEEHNYTYLVMDYASDGDLFSQILHHCRYLGQDRLIKHIFLQLLDAVEYCHSLGIYHRDLKPENVLCFDGGLRVAITDFGLATTDTFSEEFRTGSVYHMSPGCQGGDFAPTGSYSPLFNDIWSLAIILLNLATGRNPWKSASSSDPTFQAYLQDPLNFLPTVLPISAEVNNILCRMLEVDWRRRITLSEVRIAIQQVDHFYAEGVIFEGSMARCAWEIDVDIESDSDSSAPGEPADQPEELHSRWSKDSDSEMEYTRHSIRDPMRDEEYSSCHATWAIESSIRSPSPVVLEPLKIYEAPRTPPSTYSPLSPVASGSIPSVPHTPEGIGMMHNRLTLGPPKPLKINTDCGRRIFFTGSNNTHTTLSSMHTAVESTTPFSSCFYLSSPDSISKISLPWTSSAMPSSVDLGVYATPGSHHIDPTSWDYSDTDYSSSYPSTMSSSSESVVGLDLDVTSKKMLDDTSPAHLAIWRREPVITKAMNPYVPAVVMNTCRQEAHAHMGTMPIHPSLPSQPHILNSVSGPLPRPSSPVPIPIPRSSNGSEEKRWSSSLWRFSFPRVSSPPRTPPSSVEEDHRGRKGSFTDTFPFHSFFTSSPTSSWRRSPSPPASEPSPATARLHEQCRQAARTRTRRHWFSPGKLFATAGAS
ncbi:serine/threonine protein kinase, negative regulator of sexual conjugation and meiosis [Butyriboletus roseoflavus]|nr:serine/threonine protein kinase, negative regulator of sexual conjugation and meiosis [Butyriboletus roseoflavus]